MKNYHLVKDLHALEKEVMKKGYGRGLLEVGKSNDKIVALSSDVVGSTGTDAFSKEFPDRFVEVGIGEQNLVTTASGLAAMGKIPYAAAYAAFSPGRNWEQVRTTICLNNRPVKLISTHVGISDAPDGATHQMLEDIALMRALPNMIVIAPADSVEAAKATIAIASTGKPAYVRIARDETPVFTTEKTPFEIGDAYVYREGTDISIISTGRMTYNALIAAEQLAKHGYSPEVVHVPTIKPLDIKTILLSAQKTRRIVTAEEGQINGGLGGVIAEILSELLPTRIKRIGVRDRFGESGKSDELFELLGLTPKHIVFAAHQLLEE